MKAAAASTPSASHSLGASHRFVEIAATRAFMFIDSLRIAVQPVHGLPRSMGPTLIEPS
jgi:hypothetical protein